MRAELVEPRVVRLAWQRPADKGKGVVTPVGAWVERLKDRLAVFGYDARDRPITLHDSNEEGSDRAARREGSWTDYVALFTVDFCLALARQGEEAELIEAMRLHQETGLQLWLVRLESGDPALFRLASKRPFGAEAGWNVLPAAHPAAPLATRPPRTADDEMQARFIQPLAAHCADRCGD